MRRLAISLAAFLAALAPLTASAGGAATRNVPLTTAAPAARAAGDGVVGDGSAGSCNESNFDLALGASGTVTFNCGGPKTITLTSGKFITQAITIDGGHAITLAATGAMRFFDVSPAASLTLRRIVLDGATGIGAHGGAINNPGRLTIEDSTIQNNSTDLGHAGGAIFSSGSLTVTGSTFKGNSAGDGGAIFLSSPNARAFISNSRFTGNHALNTTTGSGGVFLLFAQARLTLIGSTVRGNTAKLGGGLYLSPGTSVAASGPPGTVLDLSSNTATDGGGLAYNDRGTLSVSDGFITFNQTLTPTAVGGALATFGTLTLTNSYVAGNMSRTGGGVFAGGQASPYSVFIGTSKFQANSAVNGGGLYTNAASVVMTVTESNFEQNAATGLGGGLLRANARLLILRSSFHFNHAQDGGGLYVTVSPITNTGVGGYVNIRDTTISTNTAAGLGGGLFNNDQLDLFSVTLKDNTVGLYNDGGDARLRSTVLQNSPLNCSGLLPPTDHGANFATDLSCEFNSSQQGNALNPLLAPLTSDPNGVTVYHLPLAGSPLINHGPDDCSPLDQRHALRPDNCDIGAVEFGGLLAELWLPLVKR